MADVDFFADLRVTPGAAAAAPKPPPLVDFFADLRVKPEERQPSRGFLGELSTSFLGTLTRENPKMVGNALEAMAEIVEPDAVEQAGMDIGSMVGGRKAPTTGPSGIRQLATAVQEFGKVGAQERRPAVGEFTDIRLDHLAEDASAWLGSAVGQAAGSSAPSIGVGLGLAAVTKNPMAFAAGAFGPSYVQSLGEAWETIRDDKDVQAAIKAGTITKKQVAEYAAAFAVPMAALDTFQAEKIFGGLAKDLKGNILKRMVKRAAIGAATEAPTEAAQQALNEAALEVSGGEKSFADQAKSVFNSFMAGGAGGGPIAATQPGPRAAEGPVVPPPVADGVTQITSPDAQVTQITPPGAPEGALPAEAFLPDVEEQIADAATLPDSDHLTPLDRKSPIPNELIEEGKQTIADATGQPSTFTTTQVINGKRTVVTGNVADLNAGNRAETAAVVEQVMAGVSPAPALAQSGLAAPPVSAAPVAGVPGPTGASASVAPLPEARFSATPERDIESFGPAGPTGVQARKLEQARRDRRGQPIVSQTEAGTGIEVRQPYYETFEAWVDGKKVGELNVSPQGPHTSSVTVQPQAQRKGVATALYNAAEAALGRPMTPSPMGMSGDAIAFWKKRLSDMEPEQKQALLQEALDKGVEQKIGKSARARVDALGYIEPESGQARPPVSEAAAPGVSGPPIASAAVAPAPEARIEGETDKVFAKRVVDKRPAPETLPEKYDDYFIMDEPGTVVVPMGDLVSSKTDEENRQGGGNAVKRMAAAAKGELSKRGPITVKRMANGKYLITDGNGTFTSVKDYGWKSMPVMVEEGVAEAPKKSLKELFAESREKAAKRKARAKELSAPGKPIRMTHKTDAKRTAMVGPDMSEKGRFRVTHFDEKGPVGHSTRDTLEAATEEALREGFDVAEEARFSLTDHPEETRQVEGAGHLTGFTGETATPEQKAPFFRHPYTTVDALYEDAQARQDDLVAACEGIAGRVEGVKFKNNGIKKKNTADEKIERKGYENAGQLTDVIRVGFDVDFPGQAGEIIRGLARHFEVLDEGWGVLASGYFDRKVLVRFDDGRVGEVQFWEPSLHKAKEKGFPRIAGGVRGSDLYDEERAIKDKNAPRVIELERLMNELYAHALSLADSTWARVVKDGRLSKPAPKYLNLRRQLSSDIKRQELRTSEKSASTQSVEPGLSSALASKSEKTTGRSSQLQNSTGSPPSATNVVQPAGENKALPEAKFQARTLREGSETAESIGLPPTREVTSAKGKTTTKKIRYNTRVIAAALEARQRAKYGTIERTDRSPEASDRIADWIVDEVDFEMQPGREQRSGVGWYSSKFQRALDAFGATYPELVKFGRNPTLPGLQRLENKKNARNFLTALIAITSDGALVAQNFAHASKLYDEFRQTGSIDIDKITEGGDRNYSMKTNVANVLHLLSQYGPKEMHDVLMREDTISNLKGQATSTGAQFAIKLQAHLRMPMAAVVFGPKLGSFYANLMGAHGYLTMDRWWSRTFNRYRGQLLKRVSGLMDRPTDKAGNKIGLARFKEMIGQPDLSDEEALSEALNHSKTYEEKGFKNGTEIEKAANTIRKDAIGTEDTPFGTTDRTFMIETVERARQKLADRGVTISLADIQAILWYYEKRLYSELGARETADISYEDVAKAVAERAAAGRGPKPSRVSATVRGPDGARFSISQAGRDQDSGREGAGRGGADRVGPDAGAAQAVQPQEVEPLPGLYELYPSSVGPNADITAAKQGYMESIGQPYRRQAEYVEADPKRGKRIADAFDAMEHNPSDPRVAAAYRALIDETVAQFRFLQKKLKLKISFIKPGQDNPYNFSPRLALQDVMDNGHLWVFPTEGGFGSSDLDVSDNPLLEQTDIVIDGHKLVANDVFRIVHDIFGHGPEGAGFGPTGEENAWQSHVRMYSPLAALAMTSETRGQNSWVNFGPHGEANRADPKNTTFADQKIGLLPDWVMTEGMAKDEAARFKKGLEEAAPARQLSKTTQVQGGVIHFALSPAFVERADAVWKDLRKILDSYGLEGVDLKVWQQIFADMEQGPMGVEGLYLKNLIQVALTSQHNPDTVIHHEAVHALWDKFTDIEKAILTRKSNKEWVTDKIKRDYPKSQWTEEGVAYAHAEWRKGMKVDGVIAKIFRKIDLILKAIARAFTGNDFRTAEDIFRQMATGEIGKRAQKAAGHIPDARFNMQSPPHNAQQSQQTMQGFIARGQPIDRAIRLPIQLLGGLDEQNRWWGGKRLEDKMGVNAKARREGAAIGSIVGGGLGTIFGGPGVGTGVGALAGGTVGAYVLGGPAWTANGAFGWFRSFAENAKRGLITNYGLDPNYVEAFRDSQIHKQNKEREAAGILKVLHNAGVTAKEAAVLQKILTGQPVADAEMTRLSVPIRQAIDDMGAEAVSLGLISAESFERNRGAYLHRVYVKHETNEEGGLAGWVSKNMASRRKKIIADGMKGRGMFWEMPVSRLMQDAPNRPVPGKGDKWIVIDRMNATGDKASKRVFLPAGKPIPMEFSGADWVNRGEWEVRQVGSVDPKTKVKAGPQMPDNVTLWRDYTEAERTKMGEIVDARYTIAKTFMLWANDLATGKFYRDISANPEWSQTAEPPAGTWKEGKEYNVKNGRYWENPDIQWVRVPDNNIAGTGGKKQWGALAGTFVRAAIWRDINELDLAQNPGTWRRIYRQWKANHTARHPVVHMNNVMSNLMFMDMADVRGQDLVAGIKAFFSGSKDYEEALANGAFGNDTVAQELRDQVLKPILEEITQQSTGKKNVLLNWQGIPFLQRAQLVGTVLDKLWTWAKVADDRMMQAYQAEDEIFRMALYMRRRSQGETPRQAAANAREQFLDYDIRAPWVVAMRHTLWPFISYTYRAVPQIMLAVQMRPWKIAKYAAVAYAVNALSYMLDDWGDDDDDDKITRDGETRERAALRDQEQGYTWVLSPRMVRMPWRDAHGLPVFLDIRRWIPAGDVYDTEQGSNALPIPGPLQFGGPLTMAYEFALNKKAFDGKEITNELTQTPLEQAGSVADWAWKSWTPPAFYNPGSHYWTKIWNAAKGAKPSPDSPPYSVTQSVLSSVGVKVTPVDVENGIMWHYRDFQKVQKALQSELFSNAMQLERGIISQKTHDLNAAKITEKFTNLEANIDEFEKTTAMPKKEPAR